MTAIAGCCFLRQPSSFYGPFLDDAKINDLIMGRVTLINASTKMLIDSGDCHFAFMLLYSPTNGLHTNSGKKGGIARASKRKQCWKHYFFTFENLGKDKTTWKKIPRKFTISHSCSRNSAGSDRTPNRSIIIIKQHFLGCMIA